MKKRIITAIVMIAVLVPLIIIDNLVTQIIFMSLVTAISAIGSFELMRAGYNESPTLKKYRIIIPIFASILALMSCVATLYFSQYDSYLLHIIVLLIFLLMVIIILASIVLTKDTTNKDAMTCILGLLYPGLLLGYAFSLRFFEPTALNDASILNIEGRWSFAFIYLIVVLTDSFAFWIGCRFGKHRLAPSVSPKKSVEGFIAGLVGGGIAGVASMFIFGLIDKDLDSTVVVIASFICFVISVVISLFVQMGDLVESKLKRGYDIKDFGNILPGHGGMLDRFDSLIYSGTFAFIILMSLAIISQMA